MVSAFSGGFGGAVIGQAVLEIVTDSSKAEAGLSTFERRVALGTTAAFGAAVVGASRFETTLVQIRNFTETTDAQLQKLHGTVISLSQQTGRGPQELGQALYFIASAGQTGDDALRILTASAHAAAAGLGSTADIARLVTGAVNVYGEANLSAAKATDILVAAVREGSAEPAEFAAGLGRITGIAKQMDVTFADTAAAVALMTKAAIPTDIAITGLRAVLLALANPATQSAAALQGVNINVEEIRRTIRERGLLEGLRRLYDVFGGNTEAIAAVIPEARGLTAVFALMSQDADGAQRSFDRVRNASGLTEEVFKRASQTTEFQFNKAVAAATSLLVTLGQDVLPPVASGLDGIAKAVGVASSALGVLPGPLRQAAIAGGLLIAVMPLINSQLTRGRAAWAQHTPAIVANTAALLENRNAAREAELASGQARAAAMTAVVRGRGPAAASFAVFETGEAATKSAEAAAARVAAAEARAALMAQAMKVGIVGVVGALGALGAASDNASASIAGMTAEGAAFGFIVGGPLGASIGGLIGLLTGLAGASDKARIAEDRRRAALLGRAAELAESMSEAEIRKQLTAEIELRDRLANQIQNFKPSGQGHRVDDTALRRLNTDYNDTNQRAMEFANALGIVTKGEATAGQQANAMAHSLDQAADSLRGVSAAAYAANTALELLGKMEDSVDESDFLNEGTLAKANAGRKAQLDKALSNTSSYIDQYRRQLERERQIAEIEQRITREGDPGGLLRKQIASIRDTTSNEGSISTADHQLTPAEQLIKQRTEAVFRATVQAQQSGADPAAAVARVREEQERLDRQWPQMAVTLRQFGIQANDDWRLMFEQMNDTTATELERQKARADARTRAIAEAVLGGRDPASALAKLRGQEGKVDALWPTFVEVLAKFGQTATAEMHKTFDDMGLAVKQGSERLTGSLDGLLGFLIQRRVGLGLPGALTASGMPITGAARMDSRAITQHNYITLAGDVAAKTADSRGLAEGLRRGGFGDR